MAGRDDEGGKVRMGRGGQSVHRKQGGTARAERKHQGVHGARAAGRAQGEHGAQTAWRGRPGAHGVRATGHMRQSLCGTQTTGCADNMLIRHDNT